MTRAEEINSRGHAHGSLAQSRAKRAWGRMAQEFRASVQNSSAFNVPALCTKVTATWIFYRFEDGPIPESTLTLHHERHHAKR